MGPEGIGTWSESQYLDYTHHREWELVITSASLLYKNPLNTFDPRIKGDIEL